MGSITSGRRGSDERIGAFAAEKVSMQKFLEDQKQLDPAMEALESNPAEALRLLPDTEGGRIFDEVTDRFYLPHLGCPGSMCDQMVMAFGPTR